MRYKTALVICFIAAFTVYSVAIGEGVTHRFKPRPDQYYYLFGGGDPVLKVSPGDRVVLWCEDALVGKVLTHADVFSKVAVMPSVNPQTGPIYVTGAEPGDTLALKIVDIVPDKKQAWSMLIPGFGFLVSNAFNPVLSDPSPDTVWLYPINKDRGTVTFQARNMPGFTCEIPMHPFVGTIGTAPAAGERMISLTPYWHGGNFDCLETKAGTTVYLPVNVPGAMWSTGDVHLAQGDGETGGVAVEASAWVTIDVLPLIKGKKVHTPRFEDAEYLMSTGNARPLDSAYRIGYEDMINWLVTDYGFDKWDAYQLMTQVSPVRIGNVVDTNFTVVVKFPKKYLPR